MSELTSADALNVLLNKANNRQLVIQLTKAGVEFVIIGGTALAYHGLRELYDVDDLDLLIPASGSNSEGIKNWISSLGPNYSADLSGLDKPGKKIPFKKPTDEFYAELLIAG